MAYRLNYSDYSTASGPPDPAEWVGPPGPQGVPGPVGPQGIPGPGGVPEAPSDGPIYGRGGSTLAWTPTLPLAGGVMVGALSLAGNATSALHAVPLQQLTAATAGGPFLPISYAATGTPTARSAQDRAAEVINVRDFGAIGNGIADDTTAINAAMAYVRSRAIADHTTVRVIFPAGRYVVTAPLNFTGMANWYTSITIEGCGSELWLKSATAVVDCLSSRWLTFKDLGIYGDPTATPKIGMQIGRTGSVQGDFITLINVKCGGNFTFSALYNFASETMTAYACTFNNMATTANAFCAVLDGINHWNASSTFVTVTAPANTIQSNNGITFDCCTFQATTPSGNVWLAHTNAHAFRRCYASNSGGSPFVIYQDASGQATAIYLEIECHCETAALQHMVQFTGPAGTTYALAIGLLLSDYDMPASVSILSIDGGSALTTVELRHAKFMLSGNCPALFDAPAKYVVHADEAFLADIMWAVPNYWDGPVNKISSPNKSFDVAMKWTTATRPSPVVAGAEGFATDTGRIEFYDGTAWHNPVRLDGDVMTGPLNVVLPAAGAPPIFWAVNQAGIVPAVPAPGYGGYLTFNQSNGYSDFSLVNATVGAVKSFSWFQFTSPTALSEIAFLETSGLTVAGGIGVHGTQAVTAKPVISGAKAGNTALASVIALLVAYGLGSDSTTA